MPRRIDFHRDFPSPCSCLASTPTLFVGPEMFFGDDRLDVVAEALRSQG
jgi:2-hydroxychromene-2-carboxylate isomerase